MNKHFADTRYYLGRAAEHAAAGAKAELEPVTERVANAKAELEPVTERVASAVGRGTDDEPESSRPAGLRGNAAALATRAVSEARRAVAAVRERVAAYRGRDAGER